jgi:hypothetical protein
VLFVAVGAPSPGLARMTLLSGAAWGAFTLA